MNKQEAVSQIMEIKAVLPEQLQSKLIEAVKVLASFKMISMDEDLPYNHPHLMRDIGCTSYGPLCLVKEEGVISILTVWRQPTCVYGLGKRLISL